MRHSYFLPVSLKIYGICLVMLSFLLLVAGGNYLRMTRVKQEVQDVAEFITPIAKNVRQTYLLALEQEILVERILRQKLNVTATEHGSSAVPKSEASISEVSRVEWQSLDALNTRVNQLLMQTMSLAEEAIQGSNIRNDIVAFARLSPALEQLQEDHQRLQNYNKLIIEEFSPQNSLLDDVLIRQLNSQEDVFNSRITNLQSRLNGFIQLSVLEIQHQDHSLLWFNGILTSLAFLAGILIAWFTSAKVTSPLKQLVKGGKLILQEQFSTKLSINSHDEIGELTQSFNQLMSEVAKKEKIRASFQDYIDPRIVKLIAQHPEQLTGMRNEGSVLFSDLSKFSSLSETLSPEALVAVINEHYNLSGNAILRVGGLVDKYVGDAIVAYWSPPFTDPSSHARLACRAALKHLEQMQQLRLSLPDLVGIRKGLPRIDIRIGVATGDIIAGNIGTEKKRSFSILGAPLVDAEALEQANKTFGTSILVTQATKEQAGQEFVFRFAGYLDAPKDAVALYQLYNYRDALSDTEINKFEELEAYIRRWLKRPDESNSEIFSTYLETFLQTTPDDKLARYYLNSLQNSDGED